MLRAAMTPGREEAFLGKISGLWSGISYTQQVSLCPAVLLLHVQS